MTEPKSWIDDLGMLRCNATERTKAPLCATVINFNNVTLLIPRGVKLVSFDDTKPRPATFDWGKP